jgi:hypothetical protein
MRSPSLCASADASGVHNADELMSAIVGGAKRLVASPIRTTPLSNLYNAPRRDDGPDAVLQEAAMILIPVVLVIGGLSALILYLDKRAPF